MPTTGVNGVRLHWQLTGDSGEPVVLVHGSWGDHHNWDAVVLGLSAAFRVFTYDRRGHSQSERPPGQGTIEDDVTDLAGLIGYLDLGPAHIVGNSFGGSIVLRLASRHPALFRTLAAHEPPLFGLLADQPQAHDALAQIQARVTAVAALLQAGDMAAGTRRFVETIAFGPGAWEQLPSAMRETFIFNAPTWLDEVRDPSGLNLDLAPLGTFRRPVLLSTGGQSPPFFLPVLNRLAASLPMATLATFPGAGHVPHLSHADEYVRTLTSFLRTAPGSE